MKPTDRSEYDPRSQLKHPRVVALILNWNLWKLTIECIDSLYASDYDNLSILVVDNGSDNDSALRVMHYVEEKSGSRKGGVLPRVDIMRSEQNLGYSGGNNLGMRHLVFGDNPDFILLLNNDVTVSPGAIRLLVDHALDNPDFAFLAPKILFFDRPTIIQTRGMMLTRHLLGVQHIGFGENDRDEMKGVVEVDAVYGACLLVRTELLSRLGGLDESFRFYSEDVEWCTRAKQSGLRVGCVPSSRVWHRSEASTRVFGSSMRYHNGRGRAIFLRRYGSAVVSLLNLLIWLPRELGRIVHADRSLESALWYLRGFLRVYLVDMASIRPRVSLESP